MVHLKPPGTPYAASGDSGRSSPGKKLVVSIRLEPFTSLWSLCRKHAKIATKKLTPNSPKSALAKPKSLLVSISDKAIKFSRKKKSSSSKDYDDKFDDGELWRKDILMGDKCQPLDFSGVIYYDHNGNPLSELPMKSPRASPLPSYAYAM